ncbi:MAG: phosphatase PAP2 family protein [Myxococcales bacterium]|nr:phosphatase PAP2 family protein [Myxococcales bacterium]
MRAWLLLLTLALAPSSARAQELRWSEAWSRVDPASYVVSSVGVAGALTFDQLYETPDEAWVRGPLLFDAAVRRAFRGPTLDDRERAATLSDVLFVGLLAWPVLDSLVVAGLGRQSPDVAWQLVSITSEVVALDFVLSTLLKAVVHRERPHADECSLADRRLRPDRCGTRGRTRSFYSGHTSAGFAYAGAVCMSHAYLPLYGDAGADAFACGAAMATASIVAVLRLLSDRHWASDVIVGALIGLSTGLVMPYLLHYGWDPRDDATTPTATSPLVEAPATLSFSGSF